MHKLSVVIMTYNESKHIEKCIGSVQNIADEILLVDSYSTDNTVALAEKMGAKVLFNHFDGYIEQRTFCVEQASHDFVLALDADEWLSEDLVREIKELKSESTFDCYTLNRLSKIGNHWIKHGTWFPQYILRLFHKGKATCSGSTPHDKIIPNSGATSTRLKGLLYHNCNDGYHDRILTINKQSSMAAEARKKRGVKPSYLRLIFKPFYRFFYEYFIRLGLLDGRVGFFVSITAGYYVFLREIKLFENHSSR